MNGSPGDGAREKVRMELKYCEHCGGLWLRECGSGVVYCPNCQPKVAELPAPKKRPQRVILPVRRRAVVEGFGAGGGVAGEGGLEAAGGAA
jgi:hypothetical protein